MCLCENGHLIFSVPGCIAIARKLWVDPYLSVLFLLPFNDFLIFFFISDIPFSYILRAFFKHGLDIIYPVIFFSINLIRTQP